MVIELTGMFLVDEIRLQGGGERAVSKGQGILGSGCKCRTSKLSFVVLSYALQSI